MIKVFLPMYYIFYAEGRDGSDNIAVANYFICSATTLTECLTVGETIGQLSVTATTLTTHTEV